MSLSIYYFHSSGKGSIVGFTNLGQINATYEKAFEDDGVENEFLAKSMLVFMVRGLFSKLQFPYVVQSCMAMSSTTCFEKLWNDWKDVASML